MQVKSTENNISFYEVGILVSLSCSSITCKPTEKELEGLITNYRLEIYYFIGMAILITRVTPKLSLFISTVYSLLPSGKQIRAGKIRFQKH